MHSELVLLVMVVIFALAFDYINGFHDTANSIATVVSTRVLRPSQAVAMAAVLNLFGAFIGVEVAKTIGQGIVDTGAVTQLTVMSALLSAIIWNLITWFYGIPSSSSHAIIGGLCGSVAAFAGFSMIKLEGVMKKVFIPMITSPLVGITLGFVIMILIYRFFAKSKPSVVNNMFSKLQLVSAGFMALTHGQNDAQKTMGIITLALISYTTLSVDKLSQLDNHNKMIASTDSKIAMKESNPHLKDTISKFINEGGFIINENGTYKAYKAKKKENLNANQFTKKSDLYDLTPFNELDPLVVKNLEKSLSGKELKEGEEYHVEFSVPLWVVLSCAIAMGLGTLSGGWKIIHTMGSRMIKLQPVHGFAAETSSAIMIYTASHFGMPVSTTHIISTSIMGVGAAKRFSAVKWGLVGNIVTAWVLTFPVTFALGAIILYILNFFFS